MNEVNNTEALREAEERLCHSCQHWSSWRWKYTISCPGGRTSQEMVPSDTHCTVSLMPLTTTGEDCPYWQRGLSSLRDDY